MPTGLGIGISPVLTFFGGSYINKVLGIQSANLLAYWPLNELSGTNAVNAEKTVARDGTYTGVTLNNSTGPDGRPVGLWDGVNDFVDVYSDSLRDAFNKAEGTMVVWAKVFDVGVWTDGDQRYTFILANNGSNLATPFNRSDGVDNRLKSAYIAAGTIESISSEGHSETEWLHLAISWSVAADEVRHYINGVQEGATQTTLGTWVGNLALAFCTIGSLLLVPTRIWHGYLAHAAVWDTPLTPTQILQLATV